MVDALTFREIAGYEAALSVSFPKPRTAGWVFQTLFTVWLQWVVEAGIAVGLVAWLSSEFSSPEEKPYRWWWAIAIGVYYVWVLGRMPRWFRARRARRKMLAEIAERLWAMYGCYADLSGPVLDPTRVKDALLAAESLCAKWSNATWPVLGGAIARDPHR